MPLSEALSEIARLLLSETKRRKNRAKLKTGEWDLILGFCTAVRHLARRHSWVDLKFIGATDGKDLPPDPYEEVLYKQSPHGRKLEHIEYDPDGNPYKAPGRWRPPNARKCVLRVTVYFGRPRGVGLVNA